MTVVDAFFTPGRAGRILAPILTPLNAGSLTENVSRDEGANVQAHAVIQIRLPANRLLLHRLPPHEDTVGRLTLKNEFELVLQLVGGKEPGFNSTLVSRQAVLLAFDPVTEVRVGELLQLPTIKLMVVDQGRESVAATIPDVPDERTLMKQLTVLIEETIAQPVFQRLATEACSSQQLFLYGRRP